MLLGSLAWSFVYASLPFHILGLAADAAAAVRWTGWILGIAPLTTVLTAPLWGRLTERVDPRRLYVAVELGQGLAFVGLALARTLPELFVARLVLGGLGAASTFAFVIAGRTDHPGGVRRQVAAIQSAMTLGQLVGPLAGAVAAARLGLELVLALADTAVWPYDFGELARTVAGEIESLARAAPTLALGPLRAALDTLRAADQAFRAATARPLRGAAAQARVNAELLAAQRQFVRPEGLPGAPWTRSLLFAADPDNGYATLALPGVRLALRRGDAVAAQRELDDLAMRLRAAAAALRRASAALRRPTPPRRAGPSSRP